MDTFPGHVESLVWPQIRNFDTFSDSLLTLAEVATLEEWTAVLASARAAPTEFGQQPSEDPNDSDLNLVTTVFFIVFVIVANLLLLNLFGGGVYSRQALIYIEHRHAAHSDR